MEPFQEPISYSIFGWPIVILMAIGFLINFLISRYITAKLVKNKYIKRNSIEFQKAFIAWFMPVVGALGLWMLLWTFHTIKFWKSINKWLVLKQG